jgi:hypothetical protein
MIKFPMYLRGDIGQRSFSHGLHAVEVCVTGARSFWFPIHRAWRCKDVFETLAREITLSGFITNRVSLQRRVSRSSVNLSMGHRDHRHTRHIKTLAIGHHELLFHRF